MDEDDNFDGASSNSITEIPKELEEVMETENDKKISTENEPNPLEEKLIQDLINQKSEDENSTSSQEVIFLDYSGKKGPRVRHATEIFLSFIAFAH